MDSRDTIFALSTAPGRAGIAVLRVSGPAAGAAATALAGRPLPPPRQARLTRFIDPETGEAIDRGLLLWFPGPASVTGEDLAELHLHGGRAVIAAAVEALGRMAGLRPAEAGEFTRRAFDHGKLDLSEVEGLADLIAAETEAQRRQALRQMEGALSARIGSWRFRLIRALAHFEAEIDFPDEDLPGGNQGDGDQAGGDQTGGVAGAVAPEIAAVGAEIAQALGDSHQGERLREGFQIAIVGPPNVGKSSLLNALARRDVAIVAETAGTTRDVLEVHLDLGGYPVTLADTAGLRAVADDGDDNADGADAIEAEGMRRARARAQAADLTLAVFDHRAWPAPNPETVALLNGPSLIVLNKADLSPIGPKTTDPGGPGGPSSALLVSAKTGQGLERLLEALEGAASEGLGRSGNAGSSTVITRARQRQALEDCRAALMRAEDAGPVELTAEDLRLALRALERVAGRVDVEDILDVVFRDFCIGK